MCLYRQTTDKDCAMYQQALEIHRSLSYIIISSIYFYFVVVLPASMLHICACCRNRHLCRRTIHSIKKPDEEVGVGWMKIVKTRQNQSTCHMHAYTPVRLHYSYEHITC